MKLNRISSALRNASITLGVMALPALSFAQAATDPFDTALASVTTKVTSYAGALVGVAAISVVFMVAIKYVKKLPKAS
jgi:hypothetical protein